VTYYRLRPEHARSQPKELGLATIAYESESRTGESIIPILEQMLEQATFAVLILSAEDETPSGSRRARQNVFHEAGLFQRKLGFRRSVLLLQESIEAFTNIYGLQHIPFSGDKVEQSFYELQRSFEAGRPARDCLRLDGSRRLGFPIRLYEIADLPDGGS
jgi:predicted nucleotide-binding protein